MIIDFRINSFRSTCYIMTKVQILFSSMHVQLRKVQEFGKKFACFSHEVRIQNTTFKDHAAG